MWIVRCLTGLLAMWTVATSFSQEPASKPPETAAEALERFDIGPSQLDHFVSGQPRSPDEEDVLVKILYRIPRFGLENIERWRERTIDFDQLAAAPNDHRTKIVRLSGRVKRVEKQSLIPELAERFEFAHYYRVTLDLDASPYQALIAVRRVPTAWTVDAPLDEPSAVDAMFLKVMDAVPDQSQLLFASERIGWFPDRVEADHNIGPSQVALARLGMDAGLWDDVRQSEEHALAAADREPFYQVLAALGRPGAAQLRAAQPFALVPLLEKPEEHFGEILPVQGVARRIMRIPVSDRDIRSRFGINHYYEIDLFLPLGDTALRFGNDPDGNNPVYRNAFPATLIVRELPPGLQEGENVQEQIRADGVFFKTWAYRSAFTAPFGQLQPAPLFVAVRPQHVEFEPTTNWVTGMLVTGALLLALALTGVIVWLYGRSDRQARRERMSATRQTLDLRL
jgi:hypothetical protein